MYYHISRVIFEEENKLFPAFQGEHFHNSSWIIRSTYRKANILRVNVHKLNLIHEKICENLPPRKLSARPYNDMLITHIHLQVS